MIFIQWNSFRYDTPSCALAVLSCPWQLTVLSLSDQEILLFARKVWAPFKILLEHNLITKKFNRVQYIILLAIRIINIIIILPGYSLHRDVSSQVIQMELMAFAVHMTFYQELMYSVFWQKRKEFLLLIPTILHACTSKMKAVSYSLSEGKPGLMNVTTSSCSWVCLF